MNWHAIYVEDGKVHDCDIEASDLEEAEKTLMEQHPRTTYYELGFQVKYE